MFRRVLLSALLLAATLGLATPQQADAARFYGYRGGGFKGYAGGYYGRGFRRASFNRGFGRSFDGRGYSRGFRY